MTETVRRPWKAVAQALRGVRTVGPMAPDIALDRQRPAEYVFSRHVEQAESRIKTHRQGVSRQGEVADAGD